MAQLLVVHHWPTPTVTSLTRAVVAGAHDDAITGVEVVVRPALEATTADGYLLGTPANFGYMSGALKHCKLARTTLNLLLGRWSVNQCCDLENVAARVKTVSAMHCEFFLVSSGVSFNPPSDCFTERHASQRP